MNRAPRPKKSLGQNFLQDQGIARKIVRCLDIGQDDSVIEIGPGPGALTRHIMGESPARLILLEKDDHWAEERAAALGAAVSTEAAVSAGESRTVLRGDALRFPWEDIAFPCKCIGNLPYNVASPLMWELFSRMPHLVKAVFMVQKEVGLRLCAPSGTSAYGALSVWVQSFVTPKMEFIVPPQVFYPRPKVDSAVLSFVPLAEGRPNVSLRALTQVLHKTFSMRRKQLGTIFQNVPNRMELLANIGIEPRLRPENLTPKTFHLLAGQGFFFERD